MNEAKQNWLWILSIWLGIGLLNATQTAMGMRSEGMVHDWTRVYAAISLGWIVWAIATPFVFWMARRYPPVRTSGWRAVGIHLLACFGIAVANAWWGAELQLWLRPWGGNPKDYRPIWLMVQGRLLSQLHLSLLLYGGLLLIHHSLESRRQLAQAQLAALRKQLEPHFLFNTLHGIAGMVRDGHNPEAVQMIARLSELLRKVLESSSQQFTPLAEEFEFIEKYLELQRMRFSDRLRVDVKACGELGKMAVPNLILQPLVENAIQHGIARLIEGGSIQVDAVRVPGGLLIRVRNDGPAPATAMEGVGLRNSRARLLTLYGSAAKLTLSAIEGGALAEIRLPIAQGQA